MFNKSFYFFSCIIAIILILFSYIISDTFPALKGFKSNENNKCKYK